MNENTSGIKVVLDYHESTKHQLEKYTRALWHMDWSNQPYPFRCYDGAPKIALAHGMNNEGPLFRDLFAAPLPLEGLTIKPLANYFITAWHYQLGKKYLKGRHGR
jgi:hypothetical protein